MKTIKNVTKLLELLRDNFSNIKLQLNNIKERLIFYFNRTISFIRTGEKTTISKLSEKLLVIRIVLEAQNLNKKLNSGEHVKNNYAAS